MLIFNLSYFSLNHSHQAPSYIAPSLLTSYPSTAALISSPQTTSILITMSSLSVPRIGNTSSIHAHYSFLYDTADIFPPIFSADSVEDAKQYIISSLESLEGGLCLRISKDIFFHDRIQDILEQPEKYRHILRYVYYQKERLLKVVTMGNPLHQSFVPFFSQLFLKATRDGLFTDEELSYLSVAPQSRLFSSSSVDQTADKKIASREKLPDLAIIFKRPRGKPVLTVIFEVGVTESYQDLVSDAKQWLLKAKDEVNLVVIVDIQENFRDRNAIRKTPASKARLRKLVTDYGNEAAKNRDYKDDENALEDSDIQTIPENEDHGTTHQQIESEININDWIGPHTVTLEMWERVGTTARQRGKSFVRFSFSKILLKTPSY
jgi:hypothetical protein